MMKFELLFKKQYQYREIIDMNFNIFRKGILFLAIINMFFIFSGIAIAQHEGGLGEEKVHLNIASEDQLLRIDGMTKTLAKAIVEYREESGFFKEPEDLLDVPGMTDELFDKMSPQVGTEGDLFCVPKEGSEDDWEDEEPILSPSKC
jgi:competence ComEA-like helix-hairpin-helix protein